MADFADRAECAEENQRVDALAEQKRRLDLQRATVSFKECAECGENIPKKRQLAVPGVRLCIYCQSELELKRKRGLA